MSDTKEDIAAVTKELVAGMGNEKTAPGILKVSYFVGTVILIIAALYILVPYFIQKSKNNSEGDRYAIDTFINQLKATTDTVRQFDNSIANVNSKLSIMDSKIDETKSEQNNLKHTLSEQEKRITKLEVLEEIK